MQRAAPNDQAPTGGTRRKLAIAVAAVAAAALLFAGQATAKPGRDRPARTEETTGRTKSAKVVATTTTPTTTPATTTPATTTPTVVVTRPPIIGTTTTSTVSEPGCGPRWKVAGVDEGSSTSTTGVDESCGSTATTTITTTSVQTTAVTTTAVTTITVSAETPEAPTQEQVNALHCGNVSGVYWIGNECVCVVGYWSPYASDCRLDGRSWR